MIENVAIEPMTVDQTESVIRTIKAGTDGRCDQCSAFFSESDLKPISLGNDRAITLKSGHYLMVRSGGDLSKSGLVGALGPSGTGRYAELSPTVILFRMR